jgi:tetraacyldisaccharide 4'-kinase
MIPLWTARGAAGRLGRGALVPLAGLYCATMRARRWSYEVGLRQRHALPLPAVTVGSLAVGGAGKTPLASWIAQWFVRRGTRPGIVLRGYGADDAAVPSAIVVTGGDRVAAARRAAAAGAEVLVLDDGFQHLRARADLDLVLVSAESAVLPRWSLPAGPWREDWGTLGRAGLIVVTVKAAAPQIVNQTVRAVVARAPGCRVAVARLSLERLHGLRTGQGVPLERLAGRRVLAACGIADPAAFVAQLTTAGARVRLRAWRDHHRFTRRDMAWLLGAARDTDYVILTAKDAVKLRLLWPATAREPLVAELTPRWERGRTEVDRALQVLLGDPGRRSRPATAFVASAVHDP